MHVFTYTDARNNLKSVLDKVIDDADVAFITRKEGGHAVVMGQDHYDSLMETLYLLSSPNNTISEFSVVKYFLIILIHSDL